MCLKVTISSCSAGDEEKGPKIVVAKRPRGRKDGDDENAVLFVDR